MASHGGAGVLFMYGNYAGDVMNFDMASEMLEMEGIEARTVLTTDDIASSSDPAKRRGVAGNVFIFKAAGAAADLMLPWMRSRALQPMPTPAPTRWAWRFLPARCRKPAV